MCNISEEIKRRFGETFSSLIKAAKQKGKIASLEKLAEKLNVSVPTIHRWKNGEYYPDEGNLAKICSFFGVTRDYFFSESTNGALSYDEHINNHNRCSETAKKIGLSPSMLAFLKNSRACSDLLIKASFVSRYENIVGSLDEEHEFSDSPFLLESSFGQRLYLPDDVLMALANVQSGLLEYAEFLIQKSMTDVYIAHATYRKEFFLKPQNNTGHNTVEGKELKKNGKHSKGND